MPRGIIGYEVNKEGEITPFYTNSGLVDGALSRLLNAAHSCLTFVCDGLAVASLQSVA